MNLIERIQGMRARAHMSDDAGAVRKRTGEYRALAEQLGEAQTESARLLAALPELAKTGADLTGLALKGAADRANALERYTSEVLRVAPTEPLPNTLRTAARDASTVVREIAERGRVAWEEALSQETRRPNEDLLVALERGGMNTDSIQSAALAADATLLRLHTKPLPEPGDSERLSAAFNALEKAADEAASLVDPELAQCIMQAQREQGLPLSAITPEMLRRLEELGILASFKVRL